MRLWDMRGRKGPRPADPLEPHEQYTCVPQAVCWVAADGSGRPMVEEREYLVGYVEVDKRRAAEIARNQAWSTRYAEILAAHPNHWAVLTNCHI